MGTWFSALTALARWLALPLARLLSFQTPARLHHLSLQLSALTRLETLVVHQSHYSSSGFNVCTTLPSLRRLELAFVPQLPDCLSQLTGLQELVRRAWLVLAAAGCPAMACWPALAASQLNASHTRVLA